MKKHSSNKEQQEDETKKPLNIESKPAGLKSQVEELNERIGLLMAGESKDLKKKNFKLPYKVKRFTKRLKKLADKNKVQVMLLQHNKNIKPTIGEIKEGMLIIGEKIHDGSTDSVWLWNGKVPTVIVPEWDLKPLTAENLFSNTTDNKSNAHPQAIMIRAMKFSQTMMPKNKMSGKAVIWLGIGVIVVGYVLFANQGG